jgi:hypothetical protein
VDEAKCEVRVLGVMCVVAVALAMGAYKNRARRLATNDQPVERALHKASVVLVADLREAGTADNCAEIIRLVRAARDRGIGVRELTPDSKSELLERYRVLVVPTVLILDPKGDVVARFEGEDSKTVEAIRSKLDTLVEVRH